MLELLVALCTVLICIFVLDYRAKVSRRFLKQQHEIDTHIAQIHVVAEHRERVKSNHPFHVNAHRLKVAR